MKRASLIPLLFAMFVLVACSFTNALSDRGNGNASEEEPKAVQEQPGEEAEVNESGEAVTEGEAEEISAGGSYHDEFNEAAAEWSDTLTVTTQAVGSSTSSVVKIEAGKLTFQFQAKETYAYKFLDSAFPADVVIETKFLALSHINNGVAIVCRANEDMSEWIEFRLTSRSKYNIYHYNKSLKENEGKNPYVQLAQGGVDIKTLYPMKENVVKATCSGSALALEVNGVEVASFDGAPVSSDGMVGLGAMSTDVLPIGVQFDYLDVSMP